jgi:phosphatidylglycerophosphate synthase
MESRRFLALLFAVFLVLAISLSVGATTTTGEGSGTTGGATATTGGATATTVGVTTGEPIVPAVSVEVTEAPEAQPDWTYRFFIPTLLVLAALVVIGTVIQYFTRVVRNRYRVIR